MSDASTVITVPACGTGTGSIQLVEEFICARVLDGVHFDFDFSFIRPEAKPVIREIVDDINGDPERQVLVIGHTDRVGSDRYNQGLSRRRARSVFAYIVGDVDGWMDLLRTMLDSQGNDTTPRSGSGQSADRWQTREIQYMLNFMRQPSTSAPYYNGAIDNVFGPGTQAALDAFRADNGLPPGGGAGPRIAGVDEDTWRKLFERYIALDAIQVDRGRFLDPALLGCGENFPRIETRPPGTQGQDRADADARLETNRRVEFLLIPPRLVPAQLTCEAIYNNPASPVVVCPGDPQPITVTLRFLASDGNRPPVDEQGATVQLTVNITIQGGATLQRVTDAQGKIVLADAGITQGDYRVSVQPGAQNFGLVLRDHSLGQVRGAEVLLHLTQSTVVDLIAVPVAARLNFVEDAAPFDQTIDTLPDPLTAATPITFRLAGNIRGVSGDRVVVRLSSFLLRGPASGVPGQGGGPGGGVVTPPTPLEFVDASDTPLTQVDIGRRFKLRITNDEVVGDEIVVMVSSQALRRGS